MHKLDQFFEPRSIALVGASSEPLKIGFMILCTIITGGYQGKIYPVNPRGGEIYGLKVYSRVTDIPEIPDLALIVVPPLGVNGAIEDCATRGIKSVIVITAGFAELGEEGARKQKEFTELAKRSGMTLLGPNCYGVLSPSINLYATFVPSFPIEGPIGVIAQSGNVGLSIGARASDIGFGTSRLVGIGNQTDLRSEDMLDYMAQDDKTKVILSYIEGFKDGRRFFETAREATLKKPFVMIKGGASPEGALAAKSHTASLSTPDNVIEAMCRQAGIVRAHNLQELINIGVGFLSNPLPKGRRVGIVTGGGGWGVLASDRCSKLGFQVMKLSDEILKELDSFMPAWWSRNNPIDLVAGVRTEGMLKVIEILAKWDQVDCIMTLSGILNPPPFKPGIPTAEEKEKALRMVLKMAVEEFRSIKAISEKYGKPIYIAYELVIPPEYQIELKREIGKYDIVSYDTPEEAVMVMNAMLQYAEYLGVAPAASR